MGIRLDDSPEAATFRLRDPGVLRDGEVADVQLHDCILKAACSRNGPGGFQGDGPRLVRLPVRILRPHGRIAENDGPTSVGDGGPRIGVGSRRQAAVHEFDAEVVSLAVKVSADAGPPNSAVRTFHEEGVRLHGVSLIRVVEAKGDFVSGGSPEGEGGGGRAVIIAQAAVIGESLVEGQGETPVYGFGQQLGLITVFGHFTNPAGGESLFAVPVNTGPWPVACEVPSGLIRRSLDRSRLAIIRQGKSLPFISHEKHLPKFDIPILTAKLPKRCWQERSLWISGPHPARRQSLYRIERRNYRRSARRARRQGQRSRKGHGP